MALSKPKFIYKIRDKKTGKFLSTGYKSKATWQRPSAVIDILKSSTYKDADLSVCIFPVDNCTEVSKEQFINLHPKNIS